MTRDCRNMLGKLKTVVTFIESYRHSAVFTSVWKYFAIFTRSFAFLSNLHNRQQKASDTLEHQPTVWPVPYASAQPYHSGRARYPEET